VLVLEWFLISILVPFKKLTKSKKKPKRRKKTKQEKRLATPMAEPQEERMVQYRALLHFSFQSTNLISIVQIHSTFVRCNV
jgi:hypothetical protein